MVGGTRKMVLMEAFRCSIVVGSVRVGWLRW